MLYGIYNHSIPAVVTALIAGLYFTAASASCFLTWSTSAAVKVFHIVRHIMVVTDIPSDVCL